MESQQRTDRVKLLASQWLQKARKDGWVLSRPARGNLSQVERGVSIDFLAEFLSQLRGLPQLPTTTESVVNNIINAATAEAKCPFVDLMPGHLIGPATAFISHAWEGVDFLEVLSALVDDFNMRWDAHKAYRSQRKTAAQVMAEESAMDKAKEEVKRLQQEADELLRSAGACTRWDEKPKDHVRAPATNGSESPTRIAATGQRSMSPDKTRGGNTVGAVADDVQGDGAQGSGKQALQNMLRNKPLSGVDAAEDAPPSPTNKLAAVASKLSNFGSVVDAVRQTHAADELQRVGPVKSLVQATKKIILNERAMGAGLGMGRRGTPNKAGQAAQRPTSLNVLAKSGTMRQVRPTGGEGGLLVPPKSIYVRAQASADLTRLLQPLDEEHELVEAVMEAQRAANAKAIAAKAAVEMEELAHERRRLLGYYVWIDVFALEQCLEQPNRAPDLAGMARLITVIGRTIVVVDDEWRCLNRLWCLYEIWLSIKSKAALVTLSTATALEKPASNLRASHSSILSKPDQKMSPDASNLGRAESVASVLPVELSLLEVEGASSGQDDVTQLMPLPTAIPLMEARATHSEDRNALLAHWAEEVASPRTLIHSVRQIESGIRAGLAVARERERTSQQLVKGLYNFLGLFSRTRRALGGPTFQDVVTSRDALKAISKQHFAKELKESKDVQVSDGDAELEMWQLMKFLAQQLTIRSEEPFWISELSRYCSMAHKAYATRFSASYVDQLLRAAGTFDDMRVLRNYVYGRCHAKSTTRREDTGE